MSNMKTLATALATTDKLTWHERDLMTNAVIAHAETKVDNKVLAYAYAFGMVRSILTDEQVRNLFRMTHE